ncbi:alanine--tRNA ligase [Roseibacillus persicicus]|uniref:alanine--tRNA ligase n=1 Tax=Roseibacillus persicicus TaxID=454148 RepID=UPI00280C7DC8|nr:alanine--tRNA ligase [Roseibacillus persicicus]MDQ8190638.1 alanine--tRNA ligase [Roseibacillus persicicus]
MTSAEIRQSFLDFFQEKQHTIVPSASLLPQSPGLLFTNAGMNQFVPYFLGEQAAPYSPPRAADTQKCIRAGGKHNDLEDVGYDTYHHTLFEMLGNWSFGDYFKTEAINWAWELLVDRWGFPPKRLYATVYSPSEGDPSHFDQEAYDLWKAKFESVGLDPAIHIVNGNVKDNFWMMGDTGPCGPCSELHVDMTPEGDTQGKLVNADSDLCIEIWNLVFIQYNAEADGTFRDLPAKHVDTGMGFERVVSIIQNTKGFTDFSQKPTNYNADTFQPLFRKLEELSGKKYVDIYPNDARSTGVPPVNPSTPTEDDANKPSSTPSAQLEEAIAFRVIADHIRTLSLSIADGILPGNNGRNYVLRRILRRAVKYGRNLGFSGEKTFLADLVDTLAEQLGRVFPELKAKIETVKATLQREEDSFNKTLDRGLHRFFEEARSNIVEVFIDSLENVREINFFHDGFIADFSDGRRVDYKDEEIFTSVKQGTVVPEFESYSAFELYDTFGFPVDLTALLCRERGLSLNEKAVEAHMEEQRNRSRAAQKSETVAALDINSDAVTNFVGFDSDECEATILELHPTEDKLLVITDQTPFFAEMGGQQGDEGEMLHEGSDAEYLVSGTQQIGSARGHLVPPQAQLEVGDKVTLRVFAERRRPIEAHHTATHLLHWALHEVVSPDATQQGSLVTPDRLRFDFTSAALSPDQLTAIEERVNAAIAEAQPVSWKEVPHADIKGREDIMQFFGDKYGELVRVVQIGGEPQALNGYSMELCGGTHSRNTSDLGQFIIKKEEAIASGVRRIEAAVGKAAEAYLDEQIEELKQEITQAQEKLNTANEALKNLDQAPIAEVKAPAEESLSSLRDTLAATKAAAVDAEKSLKKAQTANAAREADAFLAGLAENGQLSGNIVHAVEGPANLLQELMNGLKKLHFTHAAFLIVDDGDKLHLGSLCGKDGHDAGFGAGNLIKDLAPLVGGKGGGKPDMARGAAPQRDKKEELVQAAKEKLA